MNGHSKNQVVTLVFEADQAIWIRQDLGIASSHSLNLGCSGVAACPEHLASKWGTIVSRGKGMDQLVLHHFFRGF